MSARHALPVARSKQVVYTPAVWLLAVSPFVYLVVDVVLALILGGLYSNTVSALVLITYVLWAAALTMRDRKALLTLGYQRPPSSWWFLLTPLAYLVARTASTAREGAAGWAPIPVWILGAAAPFLLGVLSAVVIPLLLL